MILQRSILISSCRDDPTGRSPQIEHGQPALQGERTPPSFVVRPSSPRGAKIRKPSFVMTGVPVTQVEQQGIRFRQRSRRHDVGGRNMSGHDDGVTRRLSNAAPMPSSHGVSFDRSRAERRAGAGWNAHNRGPIAGTGRLTKRVSGIAEMREVPIRGTATMVDGRGWNVVWQLLDIEAATPGIYLPARVGHERQGGFRRI